MSIPRLHQTGVRRVLHAQSLVLDKGSSNIITINIIIYSCNIII